MNKQINMKSSPIHYSIVPKDLAGHVFHVRLVIAQPHPEGQVLALPAWIPGSYMVREFARNIVRIDAFANGKKIELEKIDKQTWRAAPCKTALTVEYEVYAWDLSVRAAHLDQTHGFYNGTSVFLQVMGQADQAHTVEIQKPSDACASNWRVATALPELSAERYGFGTYIAENYDALIDHPVEMGEFALITFNAHGVPHDFVLTGKVPNVDLPRIADDLQRICEAQIAFFDPKRKEAPMQRYLFLTMAIGEGMGGLEHRASTALLCSRNDLVTTNTDFESESYTNFLGLCSHEYFHTWNVKRIKPEVFSHYDLQQENYTSLLWLFEGFTSYYDDLMLVRAGLLSEEKYLKLVAKNINSVLRGTGRTKQSVAESSFDAWTKYYRQDENAPNAIVNYYTKGALIALALDLTIRAETQGKKSLDNVMRDLWRCFGFEYYEEIRVDGQRGLGEREFANVVEDVTGVNIERFLTQYVYGKEDPPLAKLLAQFGVKYVDQNNHAKSSLGARTASSGGDCKLANVYEGESAHQAGLSAGDVLIAINGIRVTASDAADQLASKLAPYAVGEAIEVHAFRRDELIQRKVSLLGDAAPNVVLKVAESKKTPCAAYRPTVKWRK